LAILATGIALCIAFDASSQAGTIYWTDTDGLSGSHRIRRANADGAGVTTLVGGLHDPRGMTLDLQNDMMYWTEPGANPPRIFRANLDGSGSQQTVVTTTDGAADVALDLGAGKLYWTESLAPGVDGKIRRANLDGTGVEDLVTGVLTHPAGLALDAIHGKVYWTDLEGTFDGLGRIQRSNLDGSNVETIISGIDEANGLAIDIAGGHIYWPEDATNKIQRANLDGSGIVDLVIGLETPTTIGLDLAEGKMYWTDSGFGGQTTNRIERANLDGTGREAIVSGDGFPWGIAVVPEPSTFLLITALALFGAGRRINA